MGSLKNIFSWSKSRDEKFRECPRQYYYHHYASWGGWEASSDPRVREFYILKNLKSRHMWVGEIVHHTIEDALKKYKQTQQMDTEFFLKGLTQRMRREFRSSREKLYRKDPRKHIGLSEHEYDQKVSDAKWVEIHDSARRCFTNFANIIFPRMVKPIPVENWKLIETMQTFNFEGTPVYVKIDFAYADDREDSEQRKVSFRRERLDNGAADGVHEGREASPLVIIDWKTGKSEDVDNEIQLDCYGLFSKEYFKIPAKSIRTMECNVNSGQTVVRKMIEAKMDFAKHYIRNSIAAMKKPLVDEEKNIAEEKDFPFTENEMTCKYCNFKKVCAKWT